MFAKKYETPMEAHDDRVLAVTRQIQELNRSMEKLRGGFYLTFTPGTKRPRRLCLLDMDFVPIVEDVEVEGAAS